MNCWHEIASFKLQLCKYSHTSTCEVQNIQIECNTAPEMPSSTPLNALLSFAKK